MPQRVHSRFRGKTIFQFQFVAGFDLDLFQEQLHRSDLVDIIGITSIAFQTKVGWRFDPLE